MRRQRNLSQMKEQDKTIVRDLRERDMSSIPDRVFKVIISNYSNIYQNKYINYKRQLINRTP